MGERTHTSAVSQSAAPKKNRTFLIVAGTGVLLLAGAVMLQISRAKPGAAVEQKAPQVQLDATKDRVVAKVGNIKITQEQLANECLALYWQDVLDDVINRTLIQHACSEQDVQVTAEEIDREVVEIAKTFNLPVDSWYHMLLAERKINAEQYRRNVIWPMLALRKLAGAQTTITENEVNNAFVRDYGPRVKTRLIVMDNLRRLQAVWEKAINKPEDFELLAREHSIDPTSRSLGGAIPPIRRFSGNDELEKAAFKLREGDISGIVQVGRSRYAILLCEGRTEPVVTDIQEVKGSIIEELKKGTQSEAVAKIFKNIKSSIRVDNYLTNTSTGGQISGNNAKEGKATVSTGTKPLRTSGRKSTTTKR